jgi:predicted amidohydrolase
MEVAAIQFAFDEAEGWDERIDRMLSLVDRQRHADLVVLPELWPNGGFTYDLWRPTAQAMSGAFVARMREAAAGLGCVVHAGSFVELHEDGSLTNTSLLLDGDGETLAVYRKIHLFGFGGGEPALMSAGADVVVVDTELGRVGLTTCYDLRFPELYRLLSDDRAELVLVPAAWPASRIDHWSVLARARAIENQAAVVAVNTAGTHGGKLMGGRSVIVDARGVVAAEAGPDEQILTASLDLADVAKWRSEFPVQADRRL